MVLLLSPTEIREEDEDRGGGGGGGGGGGKKSEMSLHFVTCC